MKKLTLHRETLHHLDLAGIHGGQALNTTAIPMPWSLAYQSCNSCRVICGSVDHTCQPACVR